MLTVTSPSWITLHPAEHRALSQVLTRLDHIFHNANNNTLSFADYMETVLYDSDIGYYQKRAVFGAQGDYITAPLLSPLFGRCLARQCHDILQQHQGGAIIEAGAGNGQLAVDILQELERLGTLPSTYWLVERSDALRENAHLRIKTAIPHLTDRVRIIPTWPSARAAIILANELLDALPTVVFEMHHGAAYPLKIAVKDGLLRWQKGPLNDEITAQLSPLQLPDHYTSEILLGAETWLQDAMNHLDRGVILLIDYGFPHHEYYHPDRKHGTLMCHFHHQAHSDPLILPGLQDITAHVDFTRLAQSALSMGLDLLGYTSQAAFLLALGITEIQSENAHADITTRQAIKKLTLPQEMGELFKVIAFGSEYTEPLRGFHLLDRRPALRLT